LTTLPSCLMFAIPIGQYAELTSGHVSMVVKIKMLPFNNQTPVLQTVVSHISDWAIPVHRVCSSKFHWLDNSFYMNLFIN
jgi:hypothetical protein